MFWIEVLYHINALHYLCKSLHYLFVLTVLLEENQQLVLVKSRLLISSFVDYSFGVILENCPTPDHKDTLQCSLFVSFMVLDYMFRCMICLEILVYGALYASKLIFFPLWQVDANYSSTICWKDSFFLLYTFVKDQLSQVLKLGTVSFELCSFSKLLWPF